MAMDLCGRMRGRSRAEDDVFIPPNEINGAMQGDQVLVELGRRAPMDGGWDALCA